MRKFVMSLARSALATILIGVASLSTISARADLTGPQIIQRCLQAYKSLKSYRGTTHVSSTDTQAGGQAAKMSSTAILKFVRPGKIRLDGAIMMTSAPFTIVSDGSKTWQTSITNSGSWEPAQSTEMAIATFTGVSGTAVTTIPAILLQTKWGDPFTGRKLGKVTVEKANGRPAYKIEATSTMGPSTYWIDQQTFLLVKMHTQMNLGSLVDDRTQTFTDVHTNGSIPASTFVRPAGAQ